MFKQIFHIALAALTVFGAIGPVPLLSGVAHAASPNTLSYQGRLKDDAGVVVADGAYDFTFTLWTDVAAGVADWTEAQTLTVTDGYFSAQLGAVDPFLNGAGQETDFTVPLWLAVEVEAEALTPRVAVNSVAYSFSSRSIESYANEAAAEADSANFGGRMYYNTTDGNLYVYDSVAGDWADTTAGAGGADDLDDAYNNFGAGAAVINVDNAQGQGNLRFTLGGTSDVVMIDASAETFVTFADDGSTTIAKALAANGTVTLGDNGDTVAINSSDWDITSAGNMTGIGTIDADGAVNFTSTLAVTGNTTLTGDLAVNGDDITSDGDLTITVTGGQLLLADTNVFNIGGVTGQAYNAISNAGGVADSVNVANDNDLYIQDDLEVDGTSVFDGNVDLNGTVTVNAVTTFNASPVFTSTLTANGAIEANGGITTQDGTSLTLNSGDVDAINIGSDADAESINIGTGAATKTITIGNGTLATVLNIDTGTGGVDIDLLGAMSVDGELLVIGGAADGNTATGDADLYVVGDFETDGIADFDGSFDFDGTTFDVDGSGLVSLTSTDASLTLAASDAGNVGDDSIVLSAGNASPDATENGNDIALEAEDDILLEATDDVDIDAADFVVLASGTVDLDSGAGTWDASTLSIDSTDTTNLTMTANDAGEKTLAIAATNAGAGAGRVNINSDGTISIDAVTASNFTVSGAADLTLRTTAGSAILQGGEAAADAVRIFADNAAGGIDMDAGTAGVDVDSTGVMSFDGELVAIGGAADGDTATGDADLYVVGDFEVDATSRFDGAATFNSDIDAFLTGTENLVIQNSTGNAAVDLISVQLTNDDTTVATQRGLVIVNAVDAAVSITESLIALDNLDGDALTDGLIVSATGVITDAIDVSAANIVNAINVGANVILGTAASINFTEFDVSDATGSITIDDDGNAGQVSVDGSVFDINSLGFVAAGQVFAGAGTALTLTGGDNGTDAGEDVIIDGENWNVGAGGLIDTNGGLTVSAGDIALTDNSGTTWSISNAGVAQFGASVTIAGTADGTDALTLTNGDIFVNNGDLDVNGGDFNVILDAGDSASISSNAATTNQPALGLTLTTDATNADNANAMTASLFLTDYADDGFSDNRQGINVTVTNNASDAGADDAISGVRIQNLGGVNQADGSEYALRIGTGWDADVLLGNFETFSNQTDDIISFSSGGGTNNQNFSIDLDAVAPSGPTLFSSDGSFVLVNDNLSVGIDGNTTENILQPAFSFSGNDLYVDDMLGVNGNIFTDGNVSLENSEQLSNVTDDLLVFSGNSGINNASITFDLDANSVGNVPAIVSGGSDLLTVFDSLSVGIDGNTTENLTNPTFAFGAGNDLYVDDMLGVNGNIFTDGMLTLQGTGDGNDSIVVTTGDILVSDGDFDVSGGDFNVTLDGNDSASISNGGNANTSPALAVVNTYTNNANSDGFTVSQTLQNYADDGVADVRMGVNISVTNNATDAGIDDTIYGLSVGNLVGAQADGSEYAMKIGTGWDGDLQFGNMETLSNQNDDMVTFTGNGGTNNATLNIDLDGAVNAVPTISDAVSDLIAVNDSLSIGVDGTTSENIGHAGFAISGGNDLYVEDDAGFNGDVYVDGMFSYGVELAMTGATPSVSSGSHYRLTQGGATTITNFTNGVAGQIIFIRVGDNNSTLDCTGSNLNCGTTDIPLGQDDFVTFFRDDPGNWQLVSLMDDSNDHSLGSGFDLAEWFQSSEELVAGDVVAVDPNGVEMIRKSQEAYESSVIGIVSTNPGITLGEPATGYASEIALAGRVPVNVTNENGAIVPGDYLTTSSTPGVAMKATEAGPVVGIAMDSFDGASGQVVAKIANFWYVPPTSSASSLQGSDGSALSAGILTAESVVVSGNAVFEGSVTVEGHLYGGADMAGRARINVGDTRVYVPFTEEYAAQPIVTATLRTATDIPGYWWVESESTTGFYIVLDGTLPYPVEFNWIALGVQAGRVSVSDGSSQEINVYVVDGGAAPVLDAPVVEEAPVVADEPVVVEEAPAEEPVVEPAPEPVVEEAPVVADELAPADEPVAEEPVVEPAPEPVVEEAPVVADEPVVEIIP